MEIDTKTVYIDDNQETYAVNLDTMYAKSFHDGQTYKITKDELKKYKVFTSKKEFMDKYPEYFI